MTNETKIHEANKILEKYNTYFTFSCFNFKDVVPSMYVKERGIPSGIIKIYCCEDSGKVRFYISSIQTVHFKNYVEFSEFQKYYESVMNDVNELNNIGIEV